MKAVRFLSVLMLLATLSACATSADEKEAADREETRKEEKEAAAKAAHDYQPRLICPQVAIIRALHVARDYGAEKPEAAQLVSIARMDSIEGNCGYTDNGIDIAFTLHMTAAKGQRLGGNHAEFPFFVAVIDPDQSILNKNQLTAEFKFPDDKKTAEHDEPLHVLIPLSKDKKSTGPNYQVLTGFQLTEDQLAEAKRIDRAADEKAVSEKPKP